MSSSLLPVEMVQLAAERLGDLREEVVFVGGAIVGLLLTDPAAKEPRPTQDVDVVIEVGATTDYYRVEKALRGLGFANVIEGPICRFKHGKLLLDVMPTSESVLGFGNRWYASALATAQSYRLTPELEIRLISAPHFLATKFEAFDSPSREDHGEYSFSRDFEDIVTVIDGREEIVAEILETGRELRTYLHDRIATHVSALGFQEGVAAHLDVDHASQARIAIVLRRLRDIIG